MDVNGNSTGLELEMRIVEDAGSFLGIPAEIKDRVSHWITEWEQSLTAVKNSRPADSKRFVIDVKQPIVGNLVIRILHTSSIQIGPSPQAGVLCGERIVDHAPHIPGARAVQPCHQH